MLPQEQGAYYTKQVHHKLFSNLGNPHLILLIPRNLICYILT